MWGCNYYNGAGFGRWFSGEGGIMGLFITALIIIITAVLIIKSVRSQQSVNSKTIDKQDSLEILKIRFAKGEINDQEFKNMKEMLRI